MSPLSSAVQGEALLSVGIDIGTSTTQCIFSCLRLENHAPAFAVPKITVTDRRVLFRAPLCLTPLSAPDTIDANRVGAYVEEAFKAAGILPGEIGVGAVIITGETARKANARAVTQALAGYAGEFVVATAGPALEGILAGKGSGAALLSRERGRRVLNLDIGGGTANLCLFERGEPIGTTCLDIGGRLLRRDPDTGRVTHLTPQIECVAADLGLFLSVGAALSPEHLAAIAGRMAHVLEEAAGIAPVTPLHEALLVDHPLPDIAAALYTFSGGVAECVYGAPDSSLFAEDMGMALGRAIAESRFFTEGRVLRPSETLHATVIGAGAYSMSVSGSTIAYDRVSFPLLGLPVGKILLESPADIPQLAARVRQQREALGEPLAIGLAGWQSPSYAQISAIAAQLVPALEGLACPVIVTEHDLAKALGQALQRLRGLDAPLVCIDGIALSYGDQIDIGAPLAEGRVLPVVVKTFAFSGA